MIPFNLEKALAGEPVVLRNGQKSFIKYIVDDCYKTDYKLRGFVVKNDLSIYGESWTLTGQSYLSNPMSERDIIGMWEEPNEKVTITIPAPLKKLLNAIANIGQLHIVESLNIIFGLVAKMN